MVTIPKALPHNQVFYKFIFGLMTFFGIGASYILLFYRNLILNPQFDVGKFMFTSFVISTPFIALGFVAVFGFQLTQKCKKYKDDKNKDKCKCSFWERNIFQWDEDTLSSIQRKMVQDVSIVLAFVVALVFYVIFLIFHSIIFSILHYIGILI